MRAAAACGEDVPCHADLLVGEAGAFVGVAVCVVALDPCHQVAGPHGMLPVVEVDAGDGAFLKGVAQDVAVVRGGLGDVGGILVFLDVLVLEHFAVHED